MAEKKFNELSQDEFFCHKCSWLWSMHSQSPKNLNFGYSTFLNEKWQTATFADLLNRPIEQVFQLGIEQYLQGEILQAIGCFQLITSLCKDRELTDTANEMLYNCKNVLKKYENLSLWQEMMTKERILPGSKQCKYYRLGDSQDDI